MLEIIRCLINGGNLKRNFGEKNYRNLMVLFLQVNYLVPITLSASLLERVTFLQNIDK